MNQDYFASILMLTVHLCCPQVVSFFHRTMLTVGLAVLSLWPFVSGISGRSQVIIARLGTQTKAPLQNKIMKHLSFHFHFHNPGFFNMILYIGTSLLFRGLNYD